MKIRIIENQKEIFISDEIIPTDFEGRTKDTSYLNEFKIKDGRVNFNSDFLYRLICYENLRQEIQGEYISNLDVFGGVGITAKMFEISPEKTFLNEIDPVLLKHLRMNFKSENVFNQDAFSFKNSKRYDIVLADYNDFTLMKASKNKTYFDSLKNLKDLSSRFLIVNDCSVFHLKYGKKSFENYSKVFNKVIFTLGEFYSEVIKYYREKFDLNVRRMEWFNNSSFILFDSEYTEEPKINKVQNNKKQTIQVL